MTSGFKFVTQAIPPIEHELVRIPSLEHDFARYTASVEAEAMYADYERKLNCELASVMDYESNVKANPKDLNDIKNRRRHRQRRLTELVGKLHELENCSGLTTTKRLDELEAAISETEAQATEIKLDSAKYQHLKERIVDGIKRKKERGIILEEQTHQVNLRLAQAKRLYNDNAIVGKTLVDKAHEMTLQQQKIQQTRLLKLHNKLSFAHELRQSLEHMKRMEILRMLPSKEQIYSQKKLNFKIDKANSMQDAILQTKIERE